MVDPLTGNAIVFNGEIYNFQVLRKECEALGDVFTSNSDTEVILALYRRYGVRCLNLMRGMFALAIWDERCQILFLGRDRVGKKPLNYAITKSGISFCSELHPLRCGPSVDSRMDAEALELYLQCQFIPAPWTIYRGIRKLLPGHYAICSGDGVQVVHYWELDYRQKLEISDSDALDALEDKLIEATRLRMIADVPVGALLSGGVDSSLVVALMAKVAKEQVRTFSIGFENDSFNELPFAQQAADRCGTLHHPEIVRGDVEDLLPALARHYGEPYADSSAVPSFFVSAAARRHVKVVLNGDGGDELLGGYPRYWLSTSALISSALLGQWLPPGAFTGVGAGLVNARSIPMRAARKLITEYIRPELRSILMYTSGWNDVERRELFPDGAHGLLSEWRQHWLERASRHADHPVDRMLWLDNHTYLPDDLLVKMDVASMHCGLEARSPLLDHEVMEFCARLPIRMKVHDRVGKRLLKQLALRYFPSEFVHRRKMGFGIPLAEWLRGPLWKVVNETLRNPELMAPLSMPTITKVVRAFQDGQDANDTRLWTLLMFGYWNGQQRARVAT
jgi:asparagine synthase (glutamine-hydrolysing)